MMEGSRTRTAELVLRDHQKLRASSNIPELQAEVSRLRGLLTRVASAPEKRAALSFASSPVREPLSPVSPALSPVREPPPDDSEAAVVPRAVTAWARALGELEEAAPTVFDSDAPVSVGVVRRDYRTRLKAEREFDAAVRASLARRRAGPKSPVKRRERPAFRHEPTVDEFFRREDTIRLRYADVVLDPAKRQACIDQAEDVLRAGRSLVLTADPTDDDAPSSRLALRTVYADFRPGLVDPFPPPITELPNGTLALNVLPKPRPGYLLDQPPS